MVRLWDGLTSTGNVLFGCDCLAVDDNAQHLGLVLLGHIQDAFDDCVGRHSGGVSELVARI